MTIESYKADKDHLRENLSKYTRKAFQMLPHVDRPRILDIGCGRGVPTLELAHLSNGQIIGLEIDETSVNECTRKIKERDLSKRVRIMRCSIQDMDFPCETFDIIWAEGSIGIVGFEKGLREWRRFLKPNGFLVLIHWDGKKMGFPEVKAYSKEMVLELMKKAGFNLVREETFLPRDTIFILTPQYTTDTGKY